MFLILRPIFAASLLITVLAISARAQADPSVTPEATPQPIPAVKGQGNITTAEQAVESAIFFYGFPGGRATLNQIRKSTLERGTTLITNPEGRVDKVNYQRYIIRGESLGKEKIRLEQEFPSARYSLIFTDGKIVGVFNNTVFTPRDDAARGFENQIVRSIEALLRYKEDDAKIELISREKLMGVDYYIIDLTDKKDRKTRFYVSAKSFRVMMLTYEDGGVKYKRKFYDYNYAQGTLVPNRTVLWADDKIIEESEVGTITFGQKVDEGLFITG